MPDWTTNMPSWSIYKTPKLFVILVLIGIAITSLKVVYNENRQHDLEIAILNSDIRQVCRSLNAKPIALYPSHRSFFRGQSNIKVLAARNIKYIDGFEGKTILDLANDRIEHWNTIGDQKKIMQARLVQEAIAKAVQNEIVEACGTR